MNHDDAMLELALRLEKFQRDHAPAFCVVTCDEDGLILHGCGPFMDAEGALAQVGRDEADVHSWPAEDQRDYRYVIVPLWEPSP